MNIGLRARHFKDFRKFLVVSLQVMQMKLYGVRYRRPTGRLGRSISVPGKSAAISWCTHDGQMDIIRKHIVLKDYPVFTVALWSLLCWFWDSDKIDALPS
jgi:hypothetical protein